MYGYRICTECKTKEVETDGGEQVSERCVDCNNKLFGLKHKDAAQAIPA